MEQVGPYRLGERLGAGGMGTVYRARRADGGPEVALKLLPREDITDPQLRRRFDREARALAELSHPHVIRVIESGVDRGQPWLAMELIEGESLAQLLERSGPLTPGEAVELSEPLCEALTYLHGRGLLHRDLKPANVLLRGGTPLLTDFGLARRLDQSQRLTQTGEIVGTPGYLAPEQCGLEAEPSEALDVYGLGAVLYALLTGRPPCAGTTLLHTLQRVLEEPPQPPSQLAPGRIDEELEAIVLRALAKAPAERFPDAASLGAALRAWRSREPRPAASRAPLALVCVAAALGLGFWLGGGATASSPPPVLGSPRPGPSLAAVSPAPSGTPAPLLPRPSPPDHQAAKARTLEQIFSLPRLPQERTPQQETQAKLALSAFERRLREHPSSPILNACYGHLLRTMGYGLTALPYLERGLHAELTEEQRTRLLRDLVSSTSEAGDFERADELLQLTESKVADPELRSLLRISRAALRVSRNPLGALALLGDSTHSLSGLYRAQAILAPEGPRERLEEIPGLLAPLLEGESRATRALAEAVLGDYHLERGELERAQARYDLAQQLLPGNPLSGLGSFALALARGERADLAARLHGVLSPPASREFVPRVVHVLQRAEVESPVRLILTVLPGLAPKHAFLIARRLSKLCPEDLSAALTPLQVTRSAFRVNMEGAQDRCLATAWYRLSQREAERFFVNDQRAPGRAFASGLAGQLDVGWSRWLADDPQRGLPGDDLPDQKSALERGIQRLLASDGDKVFFVELAIALRALGILDRERVLPYMERARAKLAARRAEQPEEADRLLIEEALTLARLGLVDRPWLAVLESAAERASGQLASELRMLLLRGSRSLAVEEGSAELAARVRHHASLLLGEQLSAGQRSLIEGCLRDAALIKGEPAEAFEHARRANELSLRGEDSRLRFVNLAQVVKIGVLAQRHDEVDALLVRERERSAASDVPLRAQLTYQRGLLWRELRPLRTLRAAERYEQLQPNHFRGPLLRALAYKALGQSAAQKKAERLAFELAPADLHDRLRVMLEE